MPPTHLLYRHGFRSSPGSFKAQRLLGWLARHRADVTARCPALPPSPADALRLVREGTADALIANGDELLACREMAAFCTGADIRLIDGSGHAPSDFDRHLPPC